MTGRTALVIALVAALMPATNVLASDAHAPVSPDHPLLSEPVTTLDGIVVVGVAPSLAVTFVTDPSCRGSRCRPAMAPTI